jgi:NitT/TauT family transport system substrate-binding protein
MSSVSWPSRRAPRWLALLLVLALVGAACGDDGDSEEETTETSEAEEGSDTTEAVEETDDTTAETDEPATDSESEEAAPEISELRVGLIPIADVAPVFIGIDQGIFEDEGLTISTEFAQGGAAAIPAVVAGDIDIAFGAYPSFFGANEQGLDLRIISEANSAAPGFAGILSLPDSGIETVEDLAGTTIAVNTLDNLVQLAVEAQLVDAGLTLDDVTLVEIGFPDMVATLETGEVDVIAVVEPFNSLAQNTLSATVVSDMFAGRVEGFPVAGFFVTAAFAEENPNTVAAFQRAFTAAVEVANGDPETVYSILPTYIETATEEGARELNYPLFVSGLDVDHIQTVPDFMAAAGLLEGEVDVAEYVVSG